MDWTRIIIDIISAVIIVIPAYFIFKKECNSVKKECENLRSALKTAENLIDKSYKHQKEMEELRQKDLGRYKDIGKKK